VDMHSDMWMVPETKAKDIDPKKKYPTWFGPIPELNPRMKEEEQEFNVMLQVRPNEVFFGNTLFKNKGDGTFEEMSDGGGMETFWPWGIAAGDFDNDGQEDAFIPAGMGYPFFYWPNSLMMNNGNDTFTDRAGTEGVEPPRDLMYTQEDVGIKSG